MNKCLAAGWLVFVFVSALTESFHDMIVSQTVSFRFTSHPDVSGFFVFDMAELAIPEAAIQKLGHAFSFLCSPICFQGRRRMKRAVLYALAAAFLTEIVQLFSAETDASAMC